MSASERRSILRRWPKPVSMRSNTAARSASSPAGSCRRRSTEGRLDPGRGDEDAGGHLGDHLGVGPPGPLHRRDAVGLRAGPGRQPLPHLELHHARACARWRARRLQQVEHERRGDVVGQVGHELPRPGRVGARGAPPSRAAMASASTTVAPSGSTTERSTGARCRSTSMAVTVGARLQQRQRERPEPRAHLHHPVARPAPRPGARSCARCWRRRRSSAPAPATPPARARPAAPGWPTASASHPEPCTPTPELGCRRQRRGRVTAIRWRPGSERAGLEEAELAGAVGPLAPAGAGLEDLAALDLLGLGGLVRVAGAADVLPGAERELEAAVVPVAAVERPVAAALALGEPVPGGGSFGSPGGDGGAVVGGAGGGGATVVGGAGAATARTTGASVVLGSTAAVVLGASVVGGAGASVTVVAGAVVTLLDVSHAVRSSEPYDTSTAASLVSARGRHVVDDEDRQGGQGHGDGEGEAAAVVPHDGVDAGLVMRLELDGDGLGLAPVDRRSGVLTPAPAASRGQQGLVVAGSSGRGGAMGRCSQRSTARWCRATVSPMTGLRSRPTWPCEHPEDVTQARNLNANNRLVIWRTLVGHRGNR